jgi:hypothetical protein
MKELFATYVLKNDKNETLAEFESNVSPEVLQDFLKENQNRFCKDKFIEYLKKFYTKIQKFSVL